MHHDSVTPDTTYRVDMGVGATKYANPDLMIPAPGVSNYYRGSHAVEQVRAYRRAVYQDVFDRIDLHVYGSTGGPRLAYVVRPGGDPANIQLVFTGQDSLGIDWQGALKVYMQGKWIELRQAMAYQVAPNGDISAVNWTAAYEIDQSNTTVHFLFDTYNHDRPLVLQIGYEPMALGGIELRDLNWSTYMGGTQDDEFTCVETDQEGNPYVCGYTLSTNFPVHPGNAHYDPFEPEAAGHVNAIVAKFEGSTKRVEWATYYGGAVAAPMPLPYDPAPARTEARKLAVYKGSFQDRDYVFVTGTTNCMDFQPYAIPNTVFDQAVHEGYGGGQKRSWVGAFRKEDGTCDWATTHGEAGAYTTNEIGLAIVVDDGGNVAVGGKLYRTNGSGVLISPVFPMLTPPGAYAHAGGGAFLLSFNADYTLRWATTVGSINPAGAYTEITDLRLVKGDQGRHLWFTGISSGPAPATDLVAPAGGGYHSTNGSVILGYFSLENLTLQYCTRWGGGDDAPVSIAYGMDVDHLKNLWVVGGTSRESLPQADAPLPEGPATIHHSTTNASGPGNRSDGFIFKMNTENHQITYGTLFGGNRYDMLLDVGHDKDHVYIIGETRSTSGLVADLDPERYFQPLGPNGNTRDALILAIRANDAPPEMLWRTAYGGLRSERGWAIASTVLPLAEVYVAGTTSSTALHAFPLHEFSPTSPLDYYQNIHLNGAGGYNSMAPWYRFEWAMNFENGGLGYASPENQHQGSDAFIASFAGHLPVGIHENPSPSPSNDLALTPMGNGTSWTVLLPDETPWQVEVYDATGRRVQHHAKVRHQLVLNLAGEAPGLYVIQAVDDGGTARTAKLAKP
ncbi:MAG TPA: T9SS type A sorting domain-containing protein [Flavobacteriales bacterium]|nr:T9SS type A sorting domain-containing protein [Flavobacteriales bacterium]